MVNELHRLFPRNIMKPCRWRSIFFFRGQWNGGRMIIWRCYIACGVAKSYKNIYCKKGEYRTEGGLNFSSSLHYLLSPPLFLLVVFLLLIELSPDRYPYSPPIFLPSCIVLLLFQHLFSPLLLIQIALFFLFLLDLALVCRHFGMQEKWLFHLFPWLSWHFHLFILFLLLLFLLIFLFATLFTFLHYFGYCGIEKYHQMFR